MKNGNVRSQLLFLTFFLSLVLCGKPLKKERFYLIMVFEGRSESPAMSPDREYMHGCRYLIGFQGTVVAD